MVLLTQLPSEIINNIFGYVAPDDLPSIRSICRRLTEHVKGNAVLHRDIYYRHLDEPPEDVDWEQSLNDLAKLRRLCGREYENFEVSCPNIHMPKMTFVYHAVTNLLKAIPPSSSLSAARSGEQHNTPQQPISSSYSPSRNAAILSNLFSKESVRNAFLQGSQLYERAHCFDYLPIPMRTIIDLERSRYVRIPVYIEYQQQSAKMHCHFGVGVQAPATLTLPNNPALSSSLNMNPYPPPTPGTNAHATPPSPPLPTRDGQLRSAFFGRTSLVPRLYPYAVSKVYDLREYTTRSKWGPFRADGSGKVDWEKVEAILLVLRTNIKLKELDRIPMVGNVWNTPFAGCWEGSLCRLPRAGDNGNNSSSTTTTDGDGQGQQGQGQGQAGGGGGPMGVGSGYAGWFLWGNNTNTQHEDWDSDVANDGAVDDMEGEEEEDGDNSDGDFAGEEEKEENRDMKLEMEDPYGVSGVWLRVVCFLDYTDFFSFNFPDDNMPCPESVPRPPLDVGEATKLLMMKIHVNRIVYPEPGTEIKGKIWPIVHWRGYARSFDGSPGEARLTWGLRGVVQMTPEGEVRWTTSSLYDGEERWRSEGIQIGGVKSARGVVGNWFDKDYNPHGPCGPTAFWKISDLEAVRPRGGHGGGQ